MKLCLACNEPITGRIDKIYCSDYCKSNYHYQKSKQKDPSNFVKIDKQLKVNRRLLQHFNQAGKSTIRKEKLLQAGFDPKFYTHTWTNQRNQTYRFCYDIGFLELPENGKTKYVLVDYQPEYMGTLPDHN